MFGIVMLSCVGLSLFVVVCERGVSMRGVRGISESDPPSPSSVGLSPVPSQTPLGRSLCYPCLLCIDVAVSVIICSVFMY